MNTDGSLREENVQAACGGIMRDHEGRFVTAWCVNLGSCSIATVELLLAKHVGPGPPKAVWGRTG